MTPEQIQAIAKGIAEGLGAPLGWAWVLLVALAAVASFLGSYLSERGKSQVIKKDIGFITREVETIRTEQQAMLESMKAEHQLRFVAAERRLAAHQQAFVLWRKLILVDDTNAAERREVSRECNDWWTNNCMYLGPRSREAFLHAYSTLNTMHFQKFQDEKAMESWIEMRMKPGTVLFEEVFMPPLAAELVDDEKKALRAKVEAAPH